MSFSYDYHLARRFSSTAELKYSQSGCPMCNVYASASSPLPSYRPAVIIIRGHGRQHPTEPPPLPIAREASSPRISRWHKLVSKLWPFDIPYSSSSPSRNSFDVQVKSVRCLIVIR